MAILLLPLMVKTAQQRNTQPRLSIVSSDVHYWVSLKPDVIKSPKILEKLSSKEYCTKKVMTDRYMVSKRKQIWFTVQRNG
jgi:hypothetical protein